MLGQFIEIMTTYMLLGLVFFCYTIPIWVPVVFVYKFAQMVKEEQARKEN